MTQSLRRSGRLVLLLLSVNLPGLPYFFGEELSAYQWPLPAEQVRQGFLAGRSPRDSLIHAPLPSLGLWFELNAAQEAQGRHAEAGRGAVVEPFYEGEIIYFETSSDPAALGAIPRNIDQTLMIQHGKLLLRYSGDNLDVGLQSSYQVRSQGRLFTASASGTAESSSRLYMEVFDTEFQTVINPRLILPRSDYGRKGSRPYVESVAFSDSAVENAEAAAPVNRVLKRADQLPRGIYNLSFRFPQNQGPPLSLNVTIDDKKLYSEIFDKVYGINSRLIINDRDLQDIYLPDEQEGKFFLGTINLDKINSSTRISVSEEYVDSRHTVNEYTVRIR